MKANYVRPADIHKTFKTTRFTENLSKCKFSTRKFYILKENIISDIP